MKFLLHPPRMSLLHPIITCQKNLTHCRKQASGNVLFLHAEKLLYRRQYNSKQTRNLKFKYESEKPKFRNSFKNVYLFIYLFFLRT